MNTTYLTKEMILNRANEVALMRHLVPTFDPNIRKNHKSIFSKKDNNPSMSIYWDGIVKKWKFKCHQTGYQVDVFSLWGYYYGLDCRTKCKDILEIKDQLKSDVFGLAQLSSNLPYIMFTTGEKECMAADAHGFITINLSSGLDVVVDI